jgi:hypothetical protein
MLHENQLYIGGLLHSQRISSNKHLFSYAKEYHGSKRNDTTTVYYFFSITLIN